MGTRFFILVVVAFIAPRMAQGQDKIANPYKTAKVGEFLAYKIRTSVGLEQEGIYKQTVTAKNDTELSLKAEDSWVGREKFERTVKIDLTKSYDVITRMVAPGKSFKGKFEKADEGKEKIKVGDKTYDCNWVSGKVVGEGKGGGKYEFDVKVWFSKSVPTIGMVKMEMKSAIGNTSMELTESGSGK